jgi:hypothetical protein
MVSYTQAAVERAMKVQEVILRAMAKKIDRRVLREIPGFCRAVFASRRKRAKRDGRRESE